MWKLIEEPDVKYFQIIFDDKIFLYSTKIGAEKFLKKFSPIMLKQIHSNIIIDINKEQKIIGDGLITSGNKSIGVKVVDCLPVYLFNAEKIAILHCGWRSIIKGIVKKAQDILEDYKYCLGAGIGTCCYEVKSDVAELFYQRYPSAIKKKNNKIFLDLKKTVIQELGAERLFADLNYCTYCHTEYFYSYRRGNRKRIMLF